MQWFSPSQNRFLPDRYVEGTCYICGYENARSDQCDKCGNLLEAGQADQSALQDRWLDAGTARNRALLPGPGQAAGAWWLNFSRSRESYWRPNVLRQSLGQILADGLHGRAITRDLDWGIPGAGGRLGLGKCLYVWFEAVIGYLSASIEWSQLAGKPDAWRDWWHEPEARSLLFHRQG